MEILKQLLPGAKRFAVFLNMSNPAAPGQRTRVEQAAIPLGVELLFFDVSDALTLRHGTDAAGKRANALINVADDVSSANRHLVIELAARHNLPVIYTVREYTEAGGLMSYGVHYPHLYYRAASYVDRILKGAKPGELPIEQPTKLELVINMKTARALGIAVPQQLLQRADEVIE
jgi:putative ABC transport system substrate-binding protein